ncbi:MAG: DoxX family protein [Bacteriovorax sp.]|nr:DoxX family protein [Bacteriovorax sp.]
MMSILPDVLKIIVFSSILFVWVIRYANIVEEFKSYGYPQWLRDIVGILKISCAIMLLNHSEQVAKVGASGIAVLMLAALLTHFKIKNPFSKMLPSLSLLVASLVIISQS